VNTKTACRLDRCCGGARRGGRGRCRSAWPCRARTSLINSAEVVTVGAGLAGLACAQRLARAGMDVLIQPAVRMKPLTTFWHTARSRRPASGCCISTPTSGVRW
jgi:FAD binding domain